MYYHLPAGESLSDDEYAKAVDVDDVVIRSLTRACYEVEDVTVYLGTVGVDNKAQQEYIKSQVESLMYMLKEIQDKLEG